MEEQGVPGQETEENNGVDPDFWPWLAQASILVVDDEPGMRNFLVRTLRPRCKRIDEASDAREASRKLDAQPYDVVILDNLLPGRTGLEWLTEQRASGLFADVILITAHADLDTAIAALRVGVVDFVLKPFRSNQLLSAVARCLDRDRLQRENAVLRQELKGASGREGLRSTLTGRSPAIEEIRKIIARVAPLPSSVLLTGESGTGKEVAARSIHALSDRGDKLFVPVNCGAIPSELLESELFGHVKGSFTGAHGAREGLIQYAKGGTIFLDEIGDLPLPMQVKLLRVIEDRRVRPVGAERETPIDVRFVFATNADLAERVNEGRFRQDLFYRINVLEIRMPRLVERGDDVEELASAFMSEVALQLGMAPVPIDEKVRRYLTRYEWPGNIRELRNFIERAVILGRFPNAYERAEEPPGRKPRTLAEVERRHILAMLKETGGDREETARRLGISRKTVDRKCATWNV
ncbi:sigma-54-dependent transcriptional regulator [Sphingomonas lycopersici]|uniref:Sigma-54 dependent transcriptional regulator n=1 Tax=Sphingomonas lycopersici TaxID=2951807 RepID=A0AA41Z6V2_9SPHN|nr:sigma-54 dependent transcriptional regulator [Sphingomonas lycopersici]MCW6533937.1 sigma-54 dependent transcriptional regulator [Sphingomonas lycopersici]